MTSALLPDIDPSLPLETQRRRLEERRKQIAAQVAAARGYTQPKGEMVGRHYVAPHWAEHLAPALQQGLAAYQSGQLEKQQTGYEQREQQAVADYLKKMGTPATETVGPSLEDAAVVVPRKRTREENLALYQEGMKIPSLRDSIGKAFEDQLIKEPEREAHRAAFGHRDQLELVDGPDDQLFVVNKQEGSARVVPGVKRKGNSYQLVTNDAGVVTAVNKKDPTDRIQIGGVGRTTAQPVPPSYQLVTGPTGEVTAVNPKDPTKTVPVGNIGKPTPLSEKTEAANAKEILGATNAIDLLKEGRTYLDTATGSGAGSLIDKAYRFAGQTNKGMESGRALKQISGQLTSQVPRFEGPQSNIDVQYYKEQAGDIGNEELTTRERLAALHEVERMHKTRIGRGGKNLRSAVEAAVETHTAPVRVNSKAERDRLAPGTRYIDPQGNISTR